MILIADSGSTKCTWAQCLTNGEIKQYHHTVGFNPKYTNYDDLVNELKNSSLSEIKHLVSEVYFYGAGCSSKSRNQVLEDPLQSFF